MSSAYRGKESSVCSWVWDWRLCFSGWPWTQVMLNKYILPHYSGCLIQHHRSDRLSDVNTRSQICCLLLTKWKLWVLQLFLLTNTAVSVSMLRSFNQVCFIQKYTFQLTLPLWCFAIMSIPLKLFCQSQNWCILLWF